MASSSQSKPSSSHDEFSRSEEDSPPDAAKVAFVFRRRYSSQAVSDSDLEPDISTAVTAAKSKMTKDSGQQREKKKLRLSIAEEALKMTSEPEVKQQQQQQQKSIIDFGLYLTKVSDIVEDKTSGKFIAYNLRDIISSHPGKLIESIQFNYMFEIDWLVRQYPRECRSAPITLVHGNQGASKADMDVEAMPYEQVNLVQARLDLPYGTHHSKMMLLRYADGLRVVIHTANLIERDWHQKTQCGWLSPLLKPASATSANDSSTEFRADLSRYLKRYRHPRVGRWAEVVEGYDFSELRVFLIASCPGRHTAEQLNDFGHLKLRKTLGQFNFDSDGSSALIGQFSSIGSLGAASESWLTGEFFSSLSAGGRLSTVSSLGGRGSALKLIYPTKDNVRQSLEGFPAGGSLPYRQSVARQQPWLNAFLHSWSASRSGRSRAMPHMKSYLRCHTSASSANLSWYLITSANLSKAAWGCLEKQGSQLAIRSYEMGVLFVAKQFGLPCFSLDSSSAPAYMPVPFDLPPQPYKASDKPWIMDLAYRDLPDTHGNIWCPPMCAD